MTYSSTSTSSFRPYSSAQSTSSSSFSRPSSLSYSRVAAQPFHLPDVDPAFYSRPPHRRSHASEDHHQQPLYHHPDPSHLTVHALPHSTSAPSASASTSSSSYSPLSLCSSVSSVSTSSSGSSALSGDSHPYHPSDSFDLHHEHMDDDHPHPSHPSHPSSRPSYYKAPPQPTASHLRHPPSAHKVVAPPPPQAVIHHPGDGFIPYPPPSTSHYTLPITVSIPAPTGGWKEPQPNAGRRREPPTVVAADFPPAPVVTAAAVGGDGMVGFMEGGSVVSKKKKQRSLRRCMDREKHSKAEQKRRGEMKALFDQLQEISSCVYKDRIHILTLAIHTIQQQQSTIEQLQQQQGKAKQDGKRVKGEGEAADAIGGKSASSPCSVGSSAASSSPSSPSSSPPTAPPTLRSETAPATVLDLTVVKREEDVEASTPTKRQRTAPPATSTPLSSFEPRELVDLSHTVSKVEENAGDLPYHSSTLASSASSSSLSTFAGSSTLAGAEYPHRDYVYLMDHEAAFADSHNTQSGVVTTQSVSSTSSYPLPCMSPAPFTFPAQQEWWPTTDVAARK